MIEHVYRRAAASPVVSRVIVATDDLRIATTRDRVRRQRPADARDHRDRHRSPRRSRRVARLRRRRQRAGRRAAASTRARSPRRSQPFGDPSIPMTTLYRRIDNPAELTNPNVVKVVLDRGGFALYFSRAPIPHARDPRGGWPPLYRHIGLYAYRRSALLVLASLEPTPLERAESLEQLRALEHGIRIKAVETAYDSIGVDTPEDLEQVRRLLAAPARTDVEASRPMTRPNTSSSPAAWFPRSARGSRRRRSAPCSRATATRSPCRSSTRTSTSIRAR